MEKQIFETMLKIRKRDSSIYDSNKHFFAEAGGSDQPSQGGRPVKSDKASKPMLLKDVIAQQVRQEIPCHIPVSAPTGHSCKFHRFQVTVLLHHI